MIEHFIPEKQTIAIIEGKLAFPETPVAGLPSAQETQNFKSQGLVCDREGRPLHPELARVIGEHGLRLGKSGFWHDWGPNYTADALLMTKPFHGPGRIVLIRRKDNGKLALPGGFVDSSEGHAYAAAFRELREETGLAADAPLSNSQIIYTGPVRDDRETIHAWPETTAVYMEADEEYVVTGGDDAEEGSASWHDIAAIEEYDLHGSHAMLIRTALMHRKERDLYAR